MGGVKSGAYPPEQGAQTETAPSKEKDLQLEMIRLWGVGPPRSEKTNDVLKNGFTFPGGLHHLAPDRLACDGDWRQEHALFAPTLNVREFRAQSQAIKLGPDIGAGRLPLWPATLAQVLGMGQQLAGHPL